MIFPGLLDLMVKQPIEVRKDFVNNLINDDNVDRERVKHVAEYIGVELVPKA